MIHAKRMGSALGIAALLLVAALRAQAQSEASPSPEETSVVAQWRGYQLKFHYSSFYTWYNCDSLADKMKYLLGELGAAPDISVRVLGCVGSSNLGNMLTGTITLRLPEALPEAVTGTATADTFTAHYRTVTLPSREQRFAGHGDDCELLEQLRDQVLPQLHVTIVADNVHCFPGQPSVAVQTLQVKALWAQSNQSATH